MNAKRLGEWVIQRRWWIILGTMAILMAAGSGGRFLGFSSDYRVFFGKENPQLKAFEQLQNTYSKNDNVLFALAPKDGKVFTRETLSVVEALTEAAWQIPYSLRVDSVSNFQHTWADGDELIVEDLVQNPATLSDADLERIKVAALAEPRLLNRIVSPKADVTGVNVTINLPGKSMDETPEVVASVREMARQIEADHPEIKVYLSGMVMMDNAFAEVSQQDMAKLVPLMYLVLILAIALMLRSFSGTFAAVLVIGFSALTAVGLAGWSHMLLTSVSVSGPTIILTLAVADSVHFLVTMFQEMRCGKTKHEAIVESMRINLQPIFLTSLTTSIGFLSMNASDSPPFQDLGNMVATGAIAAFVFSIFFLPALMAVLPVWLKKQEQPRHLLIDRIGEFVVNKRSALFLGMLALTVVFVAALPLNRLNDQFVNYFDDRYAFRTDTDFIVDHLTGIYRIEYSLESGEEWGVSDPEYLSTLEVFAQWYRSQPRVLHVSALTDIMKRLNKNMHGDDPSYDRIPEDRALAAQYLQLYEMSLPFGLDLNNQINIKKSATRFTVTLESVSTTEMLALEERAQKWLRENASPTMQVPGASTTIMFSHISERNIKSMLGGTTIALVLISLILIISFRNFKIGCLSLIPNLVPAALAFGFWGLSVGEIGVGTSVVAAMSLGIVVDDTVHFLSKYLRAKREQKMDSQDAVCYAFHTVGTSIGATSLILVAGFSVLTFSGFALNAEMGLLTAITIIFALVADFFFLPPLLMMLEKKKIEKVSKTTTCLSPAFRMDGRLGTVNELSLQTIKTKNTEQTKRRHTMRHLSIFIFAFFTISIFSMTTPMRAIALTPEERGLEIAEEMNRRDDGFKDFTATLKMILKNKQGEESVRVLRNRTLEVSGDGDKSLVIFDNPRVVKGTAFLSFTHNVENDDQWLFLPALKRVKRISASNKSGSFMGSEFAYEDIASQEVEKYTYRWLRDEEYGDKPAFVVERDPVDRKSGYARQVVWYDQAEYIPLKIDYYDRKNTLLKTLTFHGYQQYDGQYWRSERMQMINHQTGKETVLEWKDYHFKTGLSDRDFNKNSLKRAR